MERSPVQDFGRHSQQQQGMQLGHKERPRFRMRLKKDTSIAACVGQITWTTGEPKRIEAGSQRHSRETQPESLGGRREKPADSQLEQDGGEWNEAPLKSDHEKVEETQKHSQAECVNGAPQKIPEDGSRSAALLEAVQHLSSRRSSGKLMTEEKALREPVTEKHKEHSEKEEAREHCESPSVKEGCVEDQVTSRDRERRCHVAEKRNEQREISGTSIDTLKVDIYTVTCPDTFHGERISSAKHNVAVDVKKEGLPFRAAKAEGTREKVGSRCETGARERDRHTERRERNDGTRVKEHKDGSLRKVDISTKPEHHSHSRKERGKCDENSHQGSKVEERPPASKDAQRIETAHADDKRHPQSRIFEADSETKGDRPTRIYETPTRKSSYQDHTQKKHRGREVTEERRKGKLPDSSKTEANERRKEQPSRDGKESGARFRSKEAGGDEIKRETTDVDASLSARVHSTHGRKYSYCERDAERRKDDRKAGAGGEDRRKGADAQSHLRQADAPRKRRSRSAEHRRGRDEDMEARERTRSPGGSRSRHFKHRSRSRSRRMHCHRSHQKKDYGGENHSETVVAASRTRDRQSASRSRSSLDCRGPRRSIGRRRQSQRGSGPSWEKRREENRKEHGEVSSHLPHASRSHSLTPSPRKPTEGHLIDRRPSRASSRSPTGPTHSSRRNAGTSAAAAAAGQSSSNSEGKEARTGECGVPTKPLGASCVTAERRSADGESHDKSIVVRYEVRRKANAPSQEEVGHEGRRPEAKASSNIVLGAVAITKADDTAVRRLLDEKDGAEYVASSRHFRHEDHRRRRRSSGSSGDSKRSHERKEYKAGEEGHHLHTRRSSSHGRERHRNRDRHRESWRRKWREEDSASNDPRAMPSKHPPEEGGRRTWRDGRWSHRHNADRKPSGRREESTSKDVGPLVVVKKLESADPSLARLSQKNPYLDEEAGRRSPENSGRDTRKAHTEEAESDEPGKKRERREHVERSENGKEKHVYGRDVKEGHYNTCRSRRSSRADDFRTAASRSSGKTSHVETECLLTSTGGSAETEKRDDAAYTRKRDDAARDVSLGALAPSTTSAPTRTGERGRSERENTAAAQQVKRKVLCADSREGRVRSKQTAWIVEKDLPMSSPERKVMDARTSRCDTGEKTPDIVTGGCTAPSSRHDKNTEPSTVRCRRNEDPSIYRHEKETFGRRHREEESARQIRGRVESSAHGRGRSQEEKASTERQLRNFSSGDASRGSPTKASSRASKLGKGTSFDDSTGRRTPYLEQPRRGTLPDDVSRRNKFRGNDGEGRESAGEHSLKINREKRLNSKDTTYKEKSRHGRETHHPSSLQSEGQEEKVEGGDKSGFAGREDPNVSKHSNEDGAGSRAKEAFTESRSQQLGSTKEGGGTGGAASIEDAVKHDIVCGKEPDRTTGEDAIQRSPALSATGVEHDLSTERPSAVEVCGANSGKECLLDFPPAKTHEGDECAHNRHSRNSAPDRSSGERKSLGRSRPEHADALSVGVFECGPKELETPFGDNCTTHIPADGEGSVSGNESVVAADRSTTSVLDPQLSSVASLCDAKVHTVAISDSASCDDSQRHQAAISTNELVGNASPARNKFSFVNELHDAGAFVQPYKSMCSTVTEDSSCPDSVGGANVLNAENEKIGGTAVAMAYSPTAASGSPLASRDSVCTLLKGLATSPSLVSGGHRSGQHASVSSQEQTNMPPTPLPPVNKSDLGSSTATPPRQFPPPKILTCASPMPPQAPLPSHRPPPPPPSLAFGARATRPMWNSPRVTPLVPPLPTVPSPVMACSPSSSSSSVPCFSTCALPTLRLGKAPSSVEDRRTQVPADHSPIILFQPTRKPGEERQVLPHTVSVMPGAIVPPAAATASVVPTVDGCSSCGPSELPTSVPPVAPPASPPPPPETPSAQAGVDSRSTLQRLAHGLAHNRRPVRNQGLAPSVGWKPQQQTDGSLFRPARSVSAATNVAASPASDMDVSPHCTAAATAASANRQDKYSRGATETGKQSRHYDMKGDISLLWVPTITAAPKLDTTAGAQESATTVTGRENVLAADVSGHPSIVVSGRLGENLGGIAANERTAETHRLPQERQSPTQECAVVHKDSQLKPTFIQRRMSLPLCNVGIEKPPLGSRPSQPAHEVQVQKSDDCRKLSQPKQAFSREQLLGGVSIKRVKRTRQGQDATMIVAPRIPAKCPKGATLVSAGAVSAADQQADVCGRLPESASVAEVLNGTRGDRPRPLNLEGQPFRTGPGSVGRAVISFNQIKVVAEENYSLADGESRPRGAGEGSCTEVKGNSSNTPRLAFTTAAFADSTTVAPTNAQHFDGTGLSHFQRRQAAAAAAAAAAEAVRGWQRDDQVARFLQELQARHTVLGDEEAATGLATGTVAACSGSCQDGSSSDTSDTSNTFLDTTSSGYGSNGSGGLSDSPTRTGRRVLETQLRTESKKHEPCNSSRTPRQGARKDKEAAVTADTTDAREEGNSTLRSSGTTSRPLAFTNVSETESEVSSFFSPSSSSSDSSGPSVARRVQHPLRLLDQERRRFFQVAASAARKLHRLQHCRAVSPHPSLHAERGVAALAAVTLTSAEKEKDARAKNHANAFSTIAVQAVESPASSVEGREGSVLPPGSACTWLRMLGLMKKALRCAKAANEQAVSAQASAAAAVAAAAARGAFRNYLLDEHQGAVDFRDRATADQAYTAVHFHQSQSTGEADVPDATVSQRSQSRLRVAMRESQTFLPYAQGPSVARGYDENSASPGVTATCLRASHVKHVATAAAVLQKMPKSRFAKFRVSRFRRYRQCCSLNTERNRVTRSQDESPYSSKMFPVAHMQWTSTAQRRKYTTSPILRAVCTADSTGGVGNPDSGPCRGDSVTRDNTYPISDRVRAPEWFVSQTRTTSHKVEVTEGSRGGCSSRLAPGDTFCGRSRPYNISKMASQVYKKLRDAQRIGAGAGKPAAASRDAEQAIFGRSGRHCLPHGADRDFGAIGASRKSTWCDSEVSSTRSSSTSRSPSLSLAEDICETVDAGCPGVFLPTHTVEIGKKKLISSTFKTSTSSSTRIRGKGYSAVSSVAYHSSLALGAAGLEGGEVCVCSLEDMRPTRIISSPQPSRFCATATTSAAVERVSWKHSADETAAGEEHLLAVGRRGGHVELLDVRVADGRRPAISWKAHTGPVEKLKFLSTAEMYVRFWDLRGRSTTTRLGSSVTASQHKCEACTFSRSSVPTPRRMGDCAAQNRCGGCRGLLSRTLLSQPCVDSRLVRSVKMDTGVSAFAVSFDEELLAVACLCGEVQVLSLPVGPEPCEHLLSFPSVHELDCFSSLTFSRNGRGLLVCGERQFTPRMRTATQLMSYPVCELWDLQDTKQRHKMLVCASFWKHLRRHGRGNGERYAVAPTLQGSAGHAFSQDQPQPAEGRRTQGMQQPYGALALPSRQYELGNAWLLPHSLSFELPLSSFPSCVAVSVNAHSLSSQSATSAVPHGIKKGELCGTPNRGLEQWYAQSASRGVQGEVPADSNSYLIYLNSRLSNASGATGVPESSENYFGKAGRGLQISQKFVRDVPGAVEVKEMIWKRNSVKEGLSIPMRRQQSTPLQCYSDRRPSAETTYVHPACFAATDRTNNVVMLKWAQEAARFFYGPLGGDLRWPCRRFVCDLWRDKVIGVGGTLHSIGAFKQWDASTGKRRRDCKCARPRHVHFSHIFMQQVASRYPLEDYTVVPTFWFSEVSLFSVDMSAVVVDVGRRILPHKPF